MYHSNYAKTPNTDLHHSSSANAFQRSASGDKCIVSFNGHFTENLITVLTSTIEDKLRDTRESKSFQRKFAKVFIEVAHNIHHHCYRKEQKYLAKSSLEVYRDEMEYTITASNVVSKAEKRILEQYFSWLIPLSVGQVKKEFMKQIMRGDVHPRRAGLGIIKIVNKTDKKVDYNFMELGSGLFLFTLLAQVQKNEDDG